MLITFPSRHCEMISVHEDGKYAYTLVFPSPARAQAFLQQHAEAQARPTHGAFAVMCDGIRSRDVRIEELEQQTADLRKELTSAREAMGDKANEIAGDQAFVKAYQELRDKLEAKDKAVDELKSKHPDK